jgi:hypothetical protein
VTAFSLHPGTIGTTSIVRHVAPPGSCFGRVTEFLLGLLPNIGELKSLQQVRRRCVRAPATDAVCRVLNCHSQHGASAMMLAPGEKYALISPGQEARR